MKSSGGGAKLERKIVEKNRRMHMKNLCFKLSSLIPKQENDRLFKEELPQQDFFDQATSYIKKLRKRIARLKQKKDMIRVGWGLDKDISNGVMTEFGLPVIQVKHLDSNLEIVLISGLHKQFRYHELFVVLEEEGAEVVNANISVVGDRIFHTIKCRAVCSRIGLEASTIYHRLNALIQ